MAYDAGLAELMRGELVDTPGVTDKKMFGGLCFMLNGHMICGVHKDGGMARVGKQAEPEAIKIAGVQPLSFTGRPMGGMVDVSEDSIADDEIQEARHDRATRTPAIVPNYTLRGGSDGVPRHACRLS